MQKIDLIGLLIIIAIVVIASLYNSLTICNNGVCMPSYPPNLEGIKD